MRHFQVDLRKDQDVQLTVKTPYEGFRMTELSHSLSWSDNSAQWNGIVTYGEGQRASSQLTVSGQDGQFSCRLELQTPFTSDLVATLDQQVEGYSFTRKQVSSSDVWRYLLVVLQCDGQPFSSLPRAQCNLTLRPLLTID